MSRPAENHLARGRACLDCRRRKVKCGGELPSCKRCVVGGHGADCEYADERGKTRVQLLESSIAKLEARLAELQHDIPTQQPSVLVIPVPGRGGLPQSTSGSPFRLVQPGPAITRASPDTALPDGWWEQTKMPLEIAKLLMDYFAPCAFQFGFFMHGPRLVQAMFPSPKQSHSLSPPPNLVNVIYLWGIHLSGDERFLAHESTFLDRAAQFDLSGQHSHHIVQNIQAEILLANYFLRCAQPGSAMHRLSSAVSICISYGLHKQASSRPITALRLPPARDSLEQGERIDAFWATLLFYKVVSVQICASYRVSTIMDDMIDTPFPLEMNVYESGSVPTNPRATPTLRSFIDAPRADSVHQCVLTVVIKSAVFLERSKYFGIEWESVLGDPDEQIQFRKFEEDLLDFIHSLPHFTQFTGPYSKFSWISAATMLQVAIIHLHSSRKHVDSSQKCLDAAKAAANMIGNLQDIRHMPAIMPALWFTVSETLIYGIREMGDPGREISTDSSYEQFVHSLHGVVDAMKKFSIDSAEMKRQFMQVNTLFKFSNPDVS